MNSKHFVLTTALVLTAIPCFAHDTFLLPRKSHIQDGTQVTVDLTSSMSFPHTGTGIHSDRVAKGGWRTPSGSGKDDRYQEGDSSLAIKITPHGEGTAVLYVTLRPKAIELSGDDVEAYFDEIGVSQGMRDEWESRGDGATYHETYTKHAKAFLKIGDAGDDPTCRSSVGQAIEFIPQRDPTSIAVGDSLVIKVVRGGDDEIESFPVTAICGATGAAKMRRTNEAGMVAFTITNPGWWLFRSTELRRQSDGTFESDFTTMTFYIDSGQ